MAKIIEHVYNWLPLINHKMSHSFSQLTPPPSTFAPWPPWPPLHHPAPLPATTTPPRPPSHRPPQNLKNSSLQALKHSSAMLHRRAALLVCRSCLWPKNCSVDDVDSLPSPSSCSSSTYISSEPCATSTKKIKATHAPAKRIRTRSCLSFVTNDDESSATKWQTNSDGSSKVVAAEKEMFVKLSAELGSNDRNCVVLLASCALNLSLGKWRMRAVEGGEKGRH